MNANSGGQNAHKSAFTLAELLITVAVMGILGGLVINFTGNEWRRERINSLAIEWVGWLEAIRSKAADQTDAGSTLGGCTITISNLTSKPAGTALATVSPTSCASEATFRIPALGGNDRYTTLSANGASITFTPRGSVSTTNNGDVEVRFRIDNTTKMRCVRVSGILGLIRVGSNDTASGALSGLSCTDYTRF